MSKETLKWLNSQILVGFTKKNGDPWWFDRDSQGDESTVYPGPIPVEDPTSEQLFMGIRARSFEWPTKVMPFISSMIG